MNVPTIALLVGLAAFIATVEGFSQRIHHGFGASPGMFPHQVAIYGHLDKGDALCGGSLISTEYVVTAGHCVLGVKSLTLYLGMTNRSNFDGVQTMQIPVENTFTKYNDQSTMKDDIAIIKLPEEAELNDHVQTIALAKRAWVNPDTFARQAAEEIGWGINESTDKLPQDQLKFAYAEVVTNKECLKQWTRYKPLGKSIVCATNKRFHFGVCQGDSGGPLFVTKSGTRYVIGISSFIDDCSNSVKPNVFTNVAYHLDYISEITGMDFE